MWGSEMRQEPGVAEEAGLVLKHLVERLQEWEVAIADHGVS